MNIQLTQLPNGIYILNPEVSSQQLFDAKNACLCKAEALAAMAAASDFDAYTSEIISNYLWALSDMIHEARWLHKKLDGVE